MPPHNFRASISSAIASWRITTVAFPAHRALSSPLYGHSCSKWTYRFRGLLSVCDCEVNPQGSRPDQVLVARGAERTLDTDRPRRSLVSRSIPHNLNQTPTAISVPREKRGQSPRLLQDIYPRVRLKALHREKSSSLAEWWAAFRSSLWLSIGTESEKLLSQAFSGVPRHGRQKVFVR